MKVRGKRSGVRRVTRTFLVAVQAVAALLVVGSSPAGSGPTEGEKQLMAETEITVSRVAAFEPADGRLRLEDGTTCTIDE